MSEQKVSSVGQGFGFACGCCLFVVLAILAFLFSPVIFAGFLFSGAGTSEQPKPTPEVMHQQVEPQTPSPAWSMEEMRTMNQSRKAAEQIYVGQSRDDVTSLMGNEGKSKGRIKSNANTIETVVWTVGLESLEVSFRDGVVEQLQWK